MAAAPNARYFIVLMAMLSALALSCHEQSSPEEIDELISRGNVERVMNDNPGEAVSYLERAVSLAQPRSDQYWRAWGAWVLALATTDPPRARDEVIRVAEGPPDSYDYAFLVYEVARAMERAGFPALAAEIMQKCIPEARRTKVHSGN